MKNCFAIVAALFLFGCGGGGGGEPPPPPPPPPPPESGLDDYEASLQGLSLDNFYEVSIEGLIRRSPESIVWRGLQDVYPVESADLDDLSEGYRLETYEYYRVALEALRTYDRASLGAAEQVNFDVYEWYLQDQVDGLEFINYGFPATYSNFGIPRETQTFFTDIHPLEDADDVQDYLYRLSVIDRKFEQLGEWLALQRDEGIVEPGITMDVAIRQVSEIASMAAAELPYYTRFHDALPNVPGLTEAQRANFREVALSSMSSDVLPAYENLLAALQSLRTQAPTDIGVGQYPRGADYYTYILRHHTSTDLTAAEIHQLGLDELARIHAEMRTIFDDLGYPQDETLAELFARVETDGGIVAAADALTTFEDLIAFAEANVSQAFDIVPAAPVVVLPHPFGGFYIAPSFDGLRPGAFYAGTDFDQPYAPMPSLTFHETVPGHHTPVAIAMEQDLPPHRQAARTTGFVEGWALYAERLAWELGWYDNDVYGDLGRLQFEALRAARLVIDTGIHSLGWTFDEAVQFNMDNVGWSEPQSQGAAGRYSVIPAQATAYMVGMLQILDERQRAIDTLGDAFDLKAFHRALLTNGAVPLTVLPNVVDQYIADAQSGG
jgi:uncharacterized protein (DUF885 family)